MHIRVVSAAFALSLFAGTALAAGPKTVPAPATADTCFKPWTAQTKYYQWPAKPQYGSVKPLSRMSDGRFQAACLPLPGT